MASRIGVTVPERKKKGRTPIDWRDRRRTWAKSHDCKKIRDEKGKLSEEGLEYQYRSVIELGVCMNPDCFKCFEDDEEDQMEDENREEEMSYCQGCRELYRTLGRCKTCHRFVRGGDGECREVEPPQK